jgi:glycosyltransferase involved in cell wall biosynthesis
MMLPDLVSGPTLDFNPGHGRRMPYEGAALVSVVIPTRSRRDLLARALASVFAQSYPNLEVLVIDDRSDDGTAEMVAALDDPRVHWLPNDAQRGAGYSRNRGAGLSRGRFIAFLDSDDYWLQDKLWIQLEAAEQIGSDEVVIVCPPACDDGLGLGIFVVEQPMLRPGQPIADYVYAGRQATILSSCLLVSGEIGRRVRFDPNLRVNQDTDYLLQMERSGAIFHCVETPLYVLDTQRRADRISFDPSLQNASCEWFARVNDNWSPQARRGYFLWDLSVRYASTGQRGIGLRYFLKGFSLEAGPYKVLRQLVRVLGGGEIPASVKRLRRGLWPYRQRFNLLAWSSRMLRGRATLAAISSLPAPPPSAALASPEPAEEFAGLLGNPSAPTDN